MRLLCLAFRVAFYVFAVSVPFVALAAAAKLPPPVVDNELVVLLRPTPAIGFIGPAASAPPQIVASINNAGEPPGGLGVGEPTGARLAIKDRVRGRMAKWIEHNWDSPVGRLQRWTVFTYGEKSDLDEIAAQLRRNANVEAVSRHVKLELHGVSPGPVIPSDEFVGDGSEPADQAQWAVHAMNLLGGWGWLQGYARLGFVDQGIASQHFDLRATHEELGAKVWDGGAFRAHEGRDVLNNNCSVDEMDPEDVLFDPTPGHGSTVTGIAAATTDNGIPGVGGGGVAGVCWHCSALIAKVFPTGGRSEAELESAARGLDFLVRRGAQGVNMSFGANLRVFGGVWKCGVLGSNVGPLCDAMALAEQRDVVMVASAGNHRIMLHPSPDVDFPADDPRTIAVGGLELVAPGLDPVLWVNESCAKPPLQCGSWIGPSLDLMAGAEDILATSYPSFDHEVNFRCGDSLFMDDDDGLGLCTGTSMSAAFVTGQVGMIRSANPHLTKEEVRDVLTSTATFPAAKHPELAHGISDAEKAARKTLGTVAGVTLRNRLTPLFVFESPPPPGAFQAQTHVYTTVPQVGSALLLDDVRNFDTAGPTVSSYGAFPGFCTNAALPDCCPIGQSCCVGQGSECVPKFLVDADTQPRASVFIFTNHLPPTPSSPPLVPLYRLRYESAYSESCESPPSDLISPVRDFAYATSPAEVETYLNGAALNGIFKYVYDGIEGYVYEYGEAGCPLRSVALHRLYNASRRDTVIVPAPEVAAMASQGYLPPPDSDLTEIIGCGFSNADSDADMLPDGFERMIGTNIHDPDSDGDGVSDGQEILVYDRSSPDPVLHGYRDPCSSPGCPIFEDGFESGDTSAW